MSAGSCAELSAAAGEPLAATAPHAEQWLLVEVGGQWEADALSSAGLPLAARAALQGYLEATLLGRVLLIRQPAQSERRGARLYAVDGRPGRETIVGRTVATLDDLAGLDLAGGLQGEPIDHPLLLVCVHGKRDACCARVGPGLALALGQELAPDWIWQCSHMGGHRFAGNVLWLPQGIVLGRVAAGDAATVATAVRAGRLPLAHCRGRASLPPAAQAADLALRQQLGLDGVGDVSLEGIEPGAGRGESVVRLQAGGLVRSVAVTTQPAPATITSCGGEPEPQSRLVATPL